MSWKTTSESRGFQESEKFKFCTFNERLLLCGTFSKRLLGAGLHQFSTIVVALVDAGTEVTSPSDAGVFKIYWWVMVKVSRSPSSVMNWCLSGYTVLFAQTVTLELLQDIRVYINRISGDLLMRYVWFYGGVTNSFAKYIPKKT